jgi:hypothetical protein
LGEVVREYEFHPESKCADANDELCKKSTIGLLRRRHVQIDQVKYIGKESNHLEEVESGTVHADAEVYLEYLDPRRDEWQMRAIPALTKMSLSALGKNCGLSRRL